jgi:hypothetical protein
MSMSTSHPYSSGAYHHIITSASPSGHTFTARMVTQAGRDAGIESKLAGAKSLEERAQMVKDNPSPFAREDSYSRRSDGSYQPKGETGAWRTQVNLNSDRSATNWD